MLDPKPFLSENVHFLPRHLSTKLASLMDRALLHDRTVWFLVGIGWVVRVLQYAANRSLWLDEAYLALNLTRRSYADLLETLAYYQNAPIGFLLIERYFIEAMGKNEYILRLFPLLSGLAAVLLFALVARRILTKEACCFAVALFTLSDTLIYYASETKQYSTDVAVASALFLVTLWLMENRTAAAFLSFAAVGAASVWFSHPAAIVLAGMGFSVFFHFAARREWKRMSWTIVVIAVWLASFGFEYFAFLRTPALSHGLRESFGSFFVSFPPKSIMEFHKNVKLFFAMFHEGLGLHLPGIAAMFFFLGFAALWRQRSTGSWLTLPPILVALGISFLDLYPFRGRLILFLMPMIVLLIGAGAGLLWSRTRNTSPVIGLISLGLLFFYPISLVSYHVMRPRIRQELRPILIEMRQLFQTGDTVFVHSSAWPAFEYYAHELQMMPAVAPVGSEEHRNIFSYQDELDRLRGRKRVWFVFTHPLTSEGLNHKMFCLAYLRRIGKQEWGMEISSERVLEENVAGASLYLFDLTSPAEEVK